MKIITALKTLSDPMLEHRSVYTKAELHSLFPQEDDGVFNASLHRVVKQGILVRAANGVYVFEHKALPKYLLEEIAVTLRRPHTCYLSLETALSEYGIISQMPIDRITVMTTGRRGEFKTPYGVIEFTHTSRKLEAIIDGTLDCQRPMRLATRETAVRDLLRVGRNTELIDDNEIAGEAYR